MTESGVPAAAPTTRARIFVDKSSGHDTGLALGIPGSTAATVTLRAFELDGVTPAGNNPGTLNLNGNGHRAEFAGQRISGLPQGFRGVLEISSDTPFVALTLRSLVNARGDFLITTFPIADLTRAASLPMIFPQAADGGGFRTEFIFMTAGGDALVTLN